MASSIEDEERRQERLGRIRKWYVANALKFNQIAGSY